MRNSLRNFLTGLTLIAAPLSAQAPGVAPIDAKVTALAYSNPAVMFSFQDANGLWNCDTGVPPESLKKTRWKPDSLAKGQRISVVYIRDGSRISVQKLSTRRLGIIDRTLVETGKANLKIVCTMTN